MPKRNKEAERKAKKAAKEARKRMLMENIDESPPIIIDEEDDFKEKRRAIKDAIDSGYITKELLQRFLSAPLPLFLEPLQEQVGYRITYIRQQDILMPSEDELIRLRLYNGIPDKTQLIEMLGWNIRKAVLQQEEHSQYEKEVKKHIISQLLLQAEFDDGIQIKNNRITVTKGRQVFKTDQEITDTDIGELFEMKNEGLDPFGGPNWQPQFKSREEIIIKIQNIVRNLAKDAKAQSGQNKAYPEIMKLRNIASNGLILLGKQIPMYEKPLCYIKPFEDSEYAEDLFVEIKYQNGILTFLKNDIEDDINKPGFFEHANTALNMIKNFPTKLTYCGGQGLLRGYTEVAINDSKFTFELPQHMDESWEECIKHEFEKLLEFYKTSLINKWTKLAEQYPMAFDDAFSIRVAKTVYNGIKLNDLQKKCKFISGKEFNKRIDILIESGVLNTFNGKGWQKFYWGPNYEICTQPPDLNIECDANSFSIYANAKAIKDPLQRKSNILKCTGGFLLAFMDEMKKEFLYAPKPIKELIKMKINTDTDEKRVVALKQLI